MNKLTTALAGLTTLAGITANAWELDLGKNQKIDFHGFFSQGFLASTDYDYLGKTTDGSFQFTELGVNASYSPFNRTRITVQGFAFDAGQVGNLEPFLDYASLEYTFSDKLGIRAGRVRRPGGIYNHIQDVDLARTAIILPQGMYDARWRDFSTSVDGAVLFGTIPLGKAGSIGYELFGGMSGLSEEGGVAKWIEDGYQGFKLTSFKQPLFVGGQLWWNTPVPGLRAGAMVANMFDFQFNITGSAGTHPLLGPLTANVNGSGDTLHQQFSLEYVFKNWTFQAEYYTFNYPFAVTQNIMAGPNLIQTIPGSANQQPDSFYVSAAYRFNSKVEAAVYHTEYFDDKDQRSGSPNANQKDTALSLRFDIKDWWILKLEGHYINGTALLQDRVNNPNNLRTDEGWWLFAAKTTFSF